MVAIVRRILTEDEVSVGRIAAKQVQRHSKNHISEKPCLETFDIGRVLGFYGEAADVETVGPYHSFGHQKAKAGDIMHFPVEWPNPMKLKVNTKELVNVGAVYQGPLLF